MDRVVPNLEHVPERIYVRRGGIVTCRKIARIDGTGTKPVIVSGEELFRIYLSKERAKLLMEDLYYGEYTGA